MSSSLPDDINALKRLLAEQEALNRALQEKLSNREREIDHLQAQLDKLRRMNFGSRSEKVSRRIAQMEADLKALQKESDTLTGRVDDPAVQRPLRQTRTRKPFPESLPRDEKRLLPAACTQCDAIVQAPAPSRPIERGIAGPGLLARVLISKYAEHTPLYRQSEMYGRQGVELSRSLLSGWVDACCRLLSPLEEALQDYVLTDGKLHADETPVPVLLPGNKKTKTGGYGPTFVTTVTPGQRWRRRCGSLTARTEKASIRRPILRGSVVYCRRMHTPGSTSCTGMAG